MALGWTRPTVAYYADRATRPRPRTPVPGGSGCDERRGRALRVGGTTMPPKKKITAMSDGVAERMMRMVVIRSPPGPRSRAAKSA